MSENWLSMQDLAAFLQGCSGDNVDLILELRDLIRKVAPEVTEAVKFNSLCYFKSGMPYGSIGGNVCGIGEYRVTVYLTFIHGAALADPDRLLQGKGKAMRKIPVRSRADIHRPAIERLVEAAIRHDPTKGGS